jgi:hypothetical protein
MTYGNEIVSHRASTGNPSFGLQLQVTGFCTSSTPALFVHEFHHRNPLEPLPDVHPRGPVPRRRDDDQVFSPPLGLPTSSGPEDGVHTDIDLPSSREFEGPSCNTKSSSSSANSKGAVSLLGARRGLRAQLTSRRTRESLHPSHHQAQPQHVGLGQDLVLVLPVTVPFLFTTPFALSSLSTQSPPLTSMPSNAP